MSDTQTSEPGTITLSLAALTSLGDQIGEIDVVLDSLSGAQSAGKRAVINRLVKEVQDQVDEILASIDLQVFRPEENDADKAPITDDEFVGLFSGILKGLESKYTDRQNAVLESKAEEIKAETPNLTEDQIKEMTEKRKDLVMKFKATKEIFKTFGMPGVDDVPDPKRRAGAIGKRGPRAISAFRWSVDGVSQAPEKDSLAGVAGDNGYENAKELRDAMRNGDPKIDLKNPPVKIEFTLKNGKKLVGTKPEETEEDDESDLDDDDENVENEDVVTVS